MPNYSVQWEIDQDDCLNAKIAAEETLKIMNRQESIANVFIVTDKDSGKKWQVDIWQDKIEEIEIAKTGISQPSIDFINDNTTYLNQYMGSISWEKGEKTVEIKLTAEQIESINEQTK